MQPKWYAVRTPSSASWPREKNHFTLELFSIFCNFIRILSTFADLEKMTCHTFQLENALWSKQMLVRKINYKRYRNTVQVTCTWRKIDITVLFSPYDICFVLLHSTIQKHDWSYSAHSVFFLLLVHHLLQVYFSPNKFVFHSHSPQSAGIPSNPEYRLPDAANFNAWRRHLFLAQTNPSVDLVYAWEDVKAMFNGGNRKRGSNPSIRSTSQSASSEERPNSTGPSFIVEEDYEQTLGSVTKSHDDTINCNPVKRLELDMTLPAVVHSKRKRPLMMGTCLDRARDKDPGKQTLSNQCPTGFTVHQMLSHVDESNSKRLSFSANHDISSNDAESNLTSLWDSQYFNALNPSLRECFPVTSSICSNTQSAPIRPISQRPRRWFQMGIDSLISSNPQEYASYTERAKENSQNRAGSPHSSHARITSMTPSTLTPISDRTTDSSFPINLLTETMDSETPSFLHPWTVLFAHRFWQSTRTSFPINAPP